MKFSVSTWIYGSQDIKITFKKLKEFGFDAIEINGAPDDYSPKELIKLSSQYGIQIISIAGMYPWPTNNRDLSSPDFSIRKRAIEYLNDCCNFAHTIGASIIIVSPTPVGKVFPTTNFETEEEWKLASENERSFAIESLKEVSKLSEKLNITLAIEPLNRYETFLINKAEDAIKFVVDVGSESVKIHLDTFHMNIEEKSFSDAILKCGNLLVNFHIADSNRQAVGNGHIDFYDIINSLHTIKYNGPLTLEPLPPISNPYFVTRNASYWPTFDKYLKDSLLNLKNRLMMHNSRY
jgi:sugar phosphate isomerase/epimerase